MSSSLQAIHEPRDFIAARDKAEDLFDARFKEAELDCQRCNGEGWIKDDLPRGNWHRCGKCQGGSVYVELCCRCGLPESGCNCSVSDFYDVGD